MICHFLALYKYYAIWLYYTFKRFWHFNIRTDYLITQPYITSTFVFCSEKKEEKIEVENFHWFYDEEQWYEVMIFILKSKYLCVENLPTHWWPKHRAAFNLVAFFSEAQIKFSFRATIVRNIFFFFYFVYNEVSLIQIN